MRAVTHIPDRDLSLTAWFWRHLKAGLCIRDALGAAFDSWLGNFPTTMD